jgi:AdoMet-dependent rRNA methyltransferase SPB1
LTDGEITACLTDLKVLGKKEFKGLLRWREQMRLDLGFQKSRKEIGKAVEEANKAKTEEADTPEAIAERVCFTQF